MVGKNRRKEIKEYTMIREEALIKAKRIKWFLQKNPEWNNDKDVVLAAVKQWGWVIRFASNELKNDREVVMTAIQQWCGYALQYASDELRNDKDVVMAAVQKDGMALKYVSNELKNDKEIILTAVASDIDAGDYSLLEGYQNFFEIVEKEGEGFLFPCWNSEDWEIRLCVANHPNFRTNRNYFK